MSDNVKFLSGEPDGATGIARELDTTDALVTAGALLDSVKNQGTEKFAIAADGTLIGSSGPSSNPMKFLSRQVENSGQAAFEYRTDPARATNVMHTRWINGDGSPTDLLSLVAASTGGQFVFPVGANSGLRGAVGVGSGGTSNGMFFTSTNEIRFRADTVSFYSGTEGEGTGFVDVRGQLRNEGSSFNGLVGIEEGIRLLGTGSAGRKIESAEATSAQLNPGIFTIEALNDPELARDAKFLRLKDPNGDLLEFNEFGHLIHTRNGINFVAREIADSDPVAGSATVEIIDNSLDTGDQIQITVDGIGQFTFEETTDFTVGASASDTATNLANAINGTAILNERVVASPAGAIVTITALEPGTRAAHIIVEEVDNATDNFTLTTGPQGGLDNGTDDGLACVIDTDVPLSDDAERRLLSIRNNYRERVAFLPEGEMKIRVFSQDAEPTLSADNFMAMWIDTNDSNRVYLLFRRGSGDHVKIELT